MEDCYAYSLQTTFNLNYHIFWCLKYRRKVLTGKIETRLKELLYKKAQRIGATIETLEVNPNHARVLVSAKPIHSLHHI